MVMVILVLVVQMWLLTATLESYLAGHHDVAMSAFLASIGLFGVCGFLYRMLRRMDRMPEGVEASGRPGAGPWRIGERRHRSTAGVFTDRRRARVSR